jgi:tRNA threonylcarbamoyladenosine modification (KEOPS) complex  Pcc1 subunit
MTMECFVQLKNVERIDERSLVTFEVEHEAVGKLELTIKAETMSGHQAAEQGRLRLHEFALALARAAENLTPHV